MIGVPKNVDLPLLLEAFSRVLEQTGARGPMTIRMERIPQEQLNAELASRVEAAGRMRFFSAFEDHTDRVMLVGMFFAILELARLQSIRIEQDEPFGEIWLTFVPPEERDEVSGLSAPLEDATAPPEGHDSAFWAAGELEEGLPEVDDIDWAADH